MATGTPPIVIYNIADIFNMTHIRSGMGPPPTHCHLQYSRHIQYDKY